MASVSASEQSNQSYPSCIYGRDELEASGKKYPHASFESYQSHRDKKGGDDGILSIIKRADQQEHPPKAHTTEWVKDQWAKTEDKHSPDNYTAFEKPMLLNIEEQINTVLIAKPPASHFLLLGLGSPHDTHDGETAILQYVQARDLIHHCVTKLAEQYSEGDFDSHVRHHTPDIVCDSSRWFKSDRDFIRDKFRGALKHCKFLYAPLSHVLELVDSASVIVFCFCPDNPVRQMIADMAAQSTGTPRAIFCAEASKTPPSRNEERFEADRSSPQVVDFLASYEGEKCTGLPDLAPGMATWLYVDPIYPKQAESLSCSPSVPSAGNSPEATDTEASGVASSHDSQATESARSEGEETSSDVGIMTTGSLDSEVAAEVKRSWWKLTEMRDDYLYES
jgi:hypothetical protein